MFYDENIVRKQSLGRFIPTRNMDKIIIIDDSKKSCSYRKQVIENEETKSHDSIRHAPEAIKMAPLVLELRKYPDIESYVTVTAQHRQMLDQVLEAFNIKPDFDLNIMKERQTLAEITSNALVKLDELFQSIKPDIVLVHGDTTTTFAGGLAAYYHQISVGHVEAGLRTGNKYSPFPEELNRQLTGSIADLHFAPTEQAEQNLLRENKDPETIFVTGNTAIDALRTTVRDGYSHPVLEKNRE